MPDELVAEHTVAAGLPDTLVHPETATGAAVKLKLADTCACSSAGTHKLARHTKKTILCKVILHSLVVVGKYD